MCQKQHGVSPWQLVQLLFYYFRHWIVEAQGSVICHHEVEFSIVTLSIFKQIHLITAFFTSVLEGLLQRQTHV